VPRHPALLAKWPHQTWGIGAKKGYAGIALLSKIEPLRTSCGLPGDLKAETKGRVITAEYDKYILVGTYVVNAGEGLKTMPVSIALVCGVSQCLTCAFTGEASMERSLRCARRRVRLA
jgi:AP endonuclease-1